MASELSTFATAYDAAATARVGGPNLSEVDRPQRYRFDTATSTTAFTAAVAGGASDSATGAVSWFDLGPANFEGQVIPTESFISYDTGSTGTITALTVMLQKYNATDGIVALSGLATPSGLVADYFLDFTAATTLPTVVKSDRLRLGIVACTLLTAGRTLKVNICYAAKHGN